MNLDSPVKGAKPGTASPGFRFFSQYPGSAPKVQERSTPTKTVDAQSCASLSKSRQKPFTPVLDYHDTGMHNLRTFLFGKLSTVVLVPIYDGREPEFDPLRNLDKLDNLPLWNDDAPKNSLAAVGYTAHTYRTKDGKVHLSFNVQWLVVLGVSDVLDEQRDFK
jgi:hypothetical protein